MSALKLAVRGTVPAAGTAQWRALFDRSTSVDATIRDRTAVVIARVRQGGDTALRALALELDGVALESLEVPRRSWRRALDSLEPGLRHALERAAANIGAVHHAFRPDDAVVHDGRRCRGHTTPRSPRPRRRVRARGSRDLPQQSA